MMRRVAASTLALATGLQTEVAPSLRSRRISLSTGRDQAADLPASDQPPQRYELPPATLANVEMPNTYCTGAWGVERKKVGGAKADTTVEACAAEVAQDAECGKLLYFGITAQGEKQCRCVLAGRTCEPTVGPEGSSFAVYKLHDGARSQPGAPLVPQTPSTQTSPPGSAATAMPSQQLTNFDEQAEQEAERAAEQFFQEQQQTTTAASSVSNVVQAPPANSLLPPSPGAPLAAAAASTTAALEDTPGKQQVAEPSDDPQQPRRFDEQMCSSTGVARKFITLPKDGWHDLGQAVTFGGCAVSGKQSGFKNVVWNSGTNFHGDCYGFMDTMPEAGVGECQTGYCWVYGPTCNSGSAPPDEAKTPGLEVPTQTPSSEAGGGQQDPLADPFASLLPVQGQNAEQEVPPAPATTPVMPAPVEAEQPQAQPASASALAPPAMGAGNATSEVDANPQLRGNAPTAEAATLAAPLASDTQQVTAPPLTDQPPANALFGGPGEGFCAGRPIYDGPTKGWDDCRTRCDIAKCNFWSYWHTAKLTHWCKLTMHCDSRLTDKRHTVSAYRREEATLSEAEPTAQESWEHDFVANDRQEVCVASGSARKFAHAPKDGWHDLGKVASYAGCAKAAGADGYKNIIWNSGAHASGRCFGFADAVPTIFMGGCEVSYCWHYGQTCGATGSGRQEAEPWGGVMKKLLHNKAMEEAKARVREVVDAERKTTLEAQRTIREAEEKERRALEEAKEMVRAAAEARRQAERVSQRKIREAMDAKDEALENAKNIVKEAVDNERAKQERSTHEPVSSSAPAWEPTPAAPPHEQRTSSGLDMPVEPAAYAPAYSEVVGEPIAAPVEPSLTAPAEAIGAIPPEQLLPAGSGAQQQEELPLVPDQPERDLLREKQEADKSAAEEELEALRQAERDSEAAIDGLGAETGSDEEAERMFEAQMGAAMTEMDPAKAEAEAEAAASRAFDEALKDVEKDAKSRLLSEAALLGQR